MGNTPAEALRVTGIKKSVRSIKSLRSTRTTRVLFHGAMLAISAKHRRQKDSTDFMNFKDLMD